MAGKKKVDLSGWSDQLTATDNVVKGIIGTGEKKTAQSRTGAEASQGKGRPKADRETKRRVSLAVFPSVYTDLQKIAYVNRQSVSDIVTELIAGYVEEHAEQLMEYERIKG